MGVTVGGEGSGAEADDADVSWAWLRVVAAEAEGKADAGVGCVVGGGDVAEFGGEDLGAVLDGSVEERAHGDVDDGGVGLGDSERAVEVADLDEGLLRVAAMESEGEGEEQDTGRGPEKALGPAVGPCGGDGEQGGREEGDGEVVVGGEDEGEGDGDEEGSGSSSGSNEEVEEGGL